MGGDLPARETKTALSKVDLGFDLIIASCILTAIGVWLGVLLLWLQFV
jgi:hypothetical protein